MEQEIVNRVAKSGIQTLELADFAPQQPLLEIDLKDWLYMGLILKEADFRQKLEEHDWQQYQNAHVAVHCSADAVVPMWAYMLISTKLAPVAASVFHGTPAQMLEVLYLQAIRQADLSPYQGARVVIKGCGDVPVPETAYMEMTRLLQPMAKSILFGEPCSTVPVYKAPKPKA